MKKKTYIAETLEANGCRDRYDAEAKRLLSDKTILAWIMKYTMEEFSAYSIEEIRSCIEGTPEVSVVPVRPGITPEAITGMSEEDKVAGEGEVRYDILFYAFTPGKQRIKVIINVEAQQDYTPGYELVTRGIFYGARMLSAQYGTEFVSPYYDDVKKVYSVWICMDAPQYAAYTITSYHIAKEELYGHLGKEVRYDLMEVVMVCLGKEEDVSRGNRLHGMLSTLFSTRRKPEEKERILEQEYEIKASVEMEGGIRAMSNLGLWIEEKATRRGMEKGVQEGRKEGLAAVVRSLKEFVGSFDELYTLVIKNEVYKDVTREEVLKYY